MSKRGRRLIIAVGVLAAIAAGIAVASGPLQRSMMYFPDTTDPGPAARTVPGAADVVLHTDDGLDLDAWLVPPTGSDRGVAVLMASGNGGNRASRAGLATHVAERGFTVLLMDYRGYGGNPGSPSEDGLNADARAASRFLTEQGFGQECRIYFGESLGTDVV
ncbi:MAG: alpha/beta hydrolase, partial [Brooklawnia sp.]